MGITKVVTVCSVKGGTGKTLIALNLAYRLSKRGYTVGYLDADIDNASFSQFVQVGDTQLINVTDDVERRFELYDWHGIKVFSISLLVGRDKGITMDDDRYVRIIEDVLLYGNWDFGNLDVLVIDMPAGASTVFREVIRIVSERKEEPLKKLGYVGSLIVTQPLMKDSTVRTIKVHKLLGIPILGLVENMAGVKCECGKIHYIFGEPCGEEIAKEFGVKYYGALPIDPEMGKKVLKGKPFFEGEDYDKVFNEIINDIEFSEIKQPGFVRELVEKFSEKLREYAEQILAHMILYLQKEFDFTPIQVRYGFTGGKVLRFVIADEQWQNELARVTLRLKDGKLKVLKEEVSTPDFEAVTTFKTFCRMIMGKARIGKEVIDYDPETAFLTGQLKLYGKGATNLAMKVFEAVFHNTEVLEKIRQRFGHILEKFI